MYLKWVIYSFAIAVTLRLGLGTLGIISDPLMGGGQDAPIHGQKGQKRKYTPVLKCAILRKGEKL